MKKKILVFAVFVIGCILAELPPSYPGNKDLAGDPKGVNSVSAETTLSTVPLGMICVTR